MATLIIQARQNSSRFPGKILKPLGKFSVLGTIVSRVNKCKKINSFIVATTTNKEDDVIAKYCSKNDIKCFRGNENDVLDRYYQAALISSSEIIIRCTSDCPFLDNKIIDKTLDYYKNNDFDYVRFKNPVGEYDGFDVEIFSMKVLRNAWENATTKQDREHVTPYIRRNDKVGFYIIDLISKYKNLDFENLHLSLDTQEDYKLLCKINNELKSNYEMEDVFNFLNNNPELLINNTKKSPFYGNGQELYLRAKQLIPGGTQLLSKRPEMFLPNLWPAYYQKASGIEITTLDGVKMQDFSYMGIGSCILGYSDEDVNREVHNVVNRGNMSTLNCPSEVELAELLCELHPWANMARFARTGGEACSVAIRIARTASKKDKIAFCGYHGWHDWYLSANLNNDNSLDEHLLTGLNPNGVPTQLKNTAFPFRYNKIEELKNILKHHDVGTIIMEPQRGNPPLDNFLQNVRKIADENKIILIFDEITSGFRVNTGGIHLKYNVFPDIAIFGKAMSNGYPMGAIIGRRHVMSAAEDTFISSTYWTENIGPSASLVTIKKHKKLNIGKYLEELGLHFQKCLRELAEQKNIKLQITGIPPLTSFNFEYKESLKVKTLFIQKMLERNILAKNSLYLSYSHNHNNINYYLSQISEVFDELSDIIKNNDIDKSLKGPVCHSGFKRLT